MKRLTPTERILGAVLGLLLIAAGIAWWKTAPPTLHAAKANAAAITSTDLVDQSTYTTARRLAQLAIAPEEQSLSQSAPRIADHDLDLAFTEALLLGARPASARSCYVSGLGPVSSLEHDTGRFRHAAIDRLADCLA